MTGSSGLLSTWFRDLRNRGFTKKGMVWCKSSDVTLFSFQLQKSRYADRYYVNFGLWFQELGRAAHRSPNQCHVYGRFGSRSVESALDFATEQLQGDRERILGDFKEGALLPTAAACSSVEGVVSLFQSSALRLSFVRPEARLILGLER